MLVKALASKSKPELQKQTHGGVAITRGWNRVTSQFPQMRQFCCVEWIDPIPFPPSPYINIFFTFVWFSYYTFKPVTAPTMQSWAILFWNILLLVTKWICFISYSSWQEALSTQNHRAKPKYLARRRTSRCLLEPRDSVSILRKKWPAGTAVHGLALHAFCAWMPRNKTCPRLAKEKGTLRCLSAIASKLVPVRLRQETCLFRDPEDTRCFGGHKSWSWETLRKRRQGDKGWKGR